jgi:hypothetical protein
VDGGEGNLILGNSILANTDLGIALGASTEPSHDVPGNPETEGPNGFQNQPLLMSFTRDGDQVTVTFDFAAASKANRIYRFEFFASSAAGARGETFLDSVTFTSDDNGNVPADQTTITLTVAAGSFLTATATDLDGNGTSEFSDPLMV